MMQMYFHTGNSEYVLFKQLHTETDGQIGGACVAVFFLGLIYEGLKLLREYLLRKAHQKDQFTSVPLDEKPLTSRIFNIQHCIQTVLHMIQIVLSYFLMLIFMTYNAWLCIAVVLGAGVGYFIIGWKRAVVVDINEYCH